MIEHRSVPRWILAIALVFVGAGYLLMAVISWIRPASDLPVDELFPFSNLLAIVLLPLAAWRNRRSE